MSLVTEDCTPGPAEQRAYMSAKCDELVRAEQRLEAAEQVGARRLPCAIQQHGMGGMQQPPGGAAVTLVASCQLSAASGGSRAGLLIASAPDAALAARRQGLLLHIPHCRQHSVNSGICHMQDPSLNHTRDLAAARACQHSAPSALSACRQHPTD